MGGTFDPIHNGHLAIAKSVADQLALDCVLFIPTGNPHFKLDQHVTPAEMRAQMVELAIADEPRFKLDRCEIDRPGVTYTADTLEDLTSRFPNTELFFIMGADSAMTLMHWKRAERVAELCDVVVVQRPGQQTDESQELFEHLPFQINALFIDAPQLDISSTDIRERVRDGRSIEGLVPDSIIEYTTQKDLYKEEALGTE